MNAIANIDLTRPPQGWYVVTIGEIQAGDKRWSRRLEAWIPVIIGDEWTGQMAEKVMPKIIRRG